ncbi:DNA-directed RNA polymerase subunit beta [Paenibacillus albiflavus]|nr:DNA-directed RNA polymerase subunit beta [Paenibacillus albiflavus]
MMNNEHVQGYRPIGPDRKPQPNRPADPSGAGQQKKKPTKSSRPKWLRVTLRILRILFVPALFIVAIFVGLWVGYSKLGKQPSSEIFHLETWKHLFDLIFAEK